MLLSRIKFVGRSQVLNSLVGVLYRFQFFPLVLLLCTRFCIIVSWLWFSRYFAVLVLSVPGVCCSCTVPASSWTRVG